MLRIAICDDEKIFLNAFKKEIEKVCSKKNIEIQIDIFNDGFYLIEKYNKYHIIFLDIEMPLINGINVCGKINKRKGISDIPYIIFLTSKDNMVFKALQERPYTFIRKSHYSTELSGCLETLSHKIDNSESNYTIKVGRDFLVINLKDIIYLEKEKNYLIYHTKNQNYKERCNMDDKDSELNRKGFIRIHIGFLINVKHVVKFQTDSLLLDNGESFVISKKYRESAKKKYCEWLVKRYV